jgi:hypothetical protein
MKEYNTPLLSEEEGAGRGSGRAVSIDACLAVSRTNLRTYRLNQAPAQNFRMTRDEVQHASQIANQSSARPVFSLVFC